MNQSFLPFEFGILQNLVNQFRETSLVLHQIKVFLLALHVLFLLLSQRNPDYSHGLFCLEYGVFAKVGEEIDVSVLRVGDVVYDLHPEVRVQCLVFDSLE